MKRQVAKAPRRCDAEAGGCGRSAQEGAVLRDGSALCEACKEAIAEVSVEEAERLTLVRQALRAAAYSQRVALIGPKRSVDKARRDELKAVRALLRSYLRREPSLEQVYEATQ